MNLADATILIADDEPELLRFFERWFARQGCRVLVAGNGLEGLDAARQNDVDLIVSDSRMPQMDGVEMITQIKTVKQTLPTTIFVSGFTDFAARGLYDLGVEAMLHKPMSRQDLMTAAQRCLTPKQERWHASSAGVGRPVIGSQFESLSIAVQAGGIAIGRGGFCCRSDMTFRDNQQVLLQIAFAADQQALNGEGTVRWTDHLAGLVGVEITSIEDAHRDWVIGVTNTAVCDAFIPAKIQ
jgi:CheY-like chemotaxis protein